MKGQNSITLFNKTSNLISVDNEKIDALEMKRDQVIIHVNGSAIELDQCFSYDLLKYRLFSLEELQKVGFENLSENLEKLYQILQTPELFKTEELQEYEGLFFTAPEIEQYYYYARPNMITKEKQEKFHQFIEEVSALQEKIKLEQKLDLQENNSTSHKTLKV